jgi:hypothetical protein
VFQARVQASILSCPRVALGAVRGGCGELLGVKAGDGGARCHGDGASRMSECARKSAGGASIAVLLTVKVSRAAGETQWEAVVGGCSLSSVATNGGLGTSSGPDRDCARLLVASATPARLSPLTALATTIVTRTIDSPAGSRASSLAGIASRPLALQHHHFISTPHSHCPRHGSVSARHHPP